MSTLGGLRLKWVSWVVERYALLVRELVMRWVWIGLVIILEILESGARPTPTDSYRQLVGLPGLLTKYTLTLMRKEYRGARRLTTSSGTTW